MCDKWLSDHQTQNSPERCEDQESQITWEQRALCSWASPTLLDLNTYFHICNLLPNLPYSETHSASSTEDVYGSRYFLGLKVGLGKLMC